MLLSAISVIEWVNSFSADIRRDFRYASLYTYLWDRHVNAHHRNKELPDELYENHIDEMGRILSGIRKMDGVVNPFAINKGRDLGEVYIDAMKALMTEAGVVQLSKDSIKNILTPLLISKLARLSTPIPETCTVYRTIVIPKETEYRTEKVVTDYISTSLSDFQSFTLFGFDQVHYTDIDGINKIVFMHITLVKSTPVIPMFLMGYHADTEMEILITPNSGATITVDEKPEEIDSKSFLTNMAKQSRSRIDPNAYMYTLSNIEDITVEEGSMTISK